MAQDTSQPPSGWATFTIDISVNGTTEFLNQLGKSAQGAILDSMKATGTVVDAVAGSHAYVSATTLRVGGPATSPQFSVAL